MLPERDKAKAWVQRILVRMANVVVEDLRVRNVSRPAAGSIEQPGGNIRAKAGLNRSILKVNSGLGLDQPEYKMARAGGKPLAVPAMNKSRTRPNVWAGLERQSKISICLCLYGGWLQAKSRPGCSDQYHHHPKGRTGPVSLSIERRSKQ